MFNVDGLKVSFNTDDGIVHAVDGATYSVEAGKTLGIVGESGSGKSVSSLTALGLTRGPRAEISGEMTFEGRDLLSMTDDELRGIRGNDIAMIFQDPLSAMHPFYKVGYQLNEAVRAHNDVSKKAARARSIELLTLVGIPDPERRVDAYPHEFSGGMRQRAMIAMALANEPKLLIADEPTTALDVTVQAQILARLNDLQTRLGMAIIIITHDLGVVAEIADDIAVMYAGRIVEHAPTREIFTAPQHPYTWGLLKSIPRLDTLRGSELEPIPGRPPSLINRPTGCHFHPRCPYAREAHQHTDPKLIDVPGAPAHQVACLLTAAERTLAWGALARGETPAAAAELIRPKVGVAAPGDGGEEAQT
jgi:peptide/nickel transport system ATP-binding protein